MSFYLVFIITLIVSMSSIQSWLNPKAPIKLLIPRFIGISPESRGYFSHICNVTDINQTCNSIYLQSAQVQLFIYPHLHLDSSSDQGNGRHESSPWFYPPGVLGWIINSCLIWHLPLVLSLHLIHDQPADTDWNMCSLLISVIYLHHDVVDKKELEQATVWQYVWATF